MDNAEVSWLLTGRNGNLTVNSNIEAHAAKISPLESYLNNHEPQVCAFHENRQREKGETSGVQKQLHQPSRDWAGDNSSTKKGRKFM